MHRNSIRLSVSSSTCAGIEGEIYERIKGKVAAVESIVEELDADPERVKRLTGWSWIVTTLCALPQNHAA